MAAMTGAFGSLPSSLKDKQRQAVLRLLNFNSNDNGERGIAEIQNDVCCLVPQNPLHLSQSWRLHSQQHCL